MKGNEYCEEAASQDTLSALDQDNTSITRQKTHAPRCLLAGVRPSLSFAHFVVRALACRVDDRELCCFRVKQRSLLLPHLATLTLPPRGHPATSHLPKSLY